MIILSKYCKCDVNPWISWRTKRLFASRLLSNFVAAAFKTEWFINRCKTMFGASLRRKKHFLPYFPPFDKVGVVHKWRHAIWIYICWHPSSLPLLPFMALNTHGLCHTIYMVLLMLIYCCHKIIDPSLLSVGRPERDDYRTLGTQYFCTCAKPSKFMWKKNSTRKLDLSW